MNSKLKVKLVSLVLMFVLVIVVLFVSVFAVSNADIGLSGSINFKPSTDVYAKLTGSISGMKESTITLPELIFSENPDNNPSSEEIINQWKGKALNFTESADQITFSITVENLSTSRKLYVMVKDQVGAVVNLNKTVTAPGYADALNQSIEVAPSGSGNSTLTFTITFNVANPSQNVDGTFSYLISLFDESLNNAELTAQPNNDLYGSASISGGTGTDGKFNIGDTVNLTASANSGYTFMAWATSTDPETMQILSTEPNYSFEYSPTSSKQYYALFNETTTDITKENNVTYTLYNEAKLAMAKDAATSISGDLVIPSTVLNGSESFKVYSIGDRAFESCRELTKIILPNSLITIGNYAFYGCGGLTTITIPEGVTSIGYSAFSGCSGLTGKLTIPEGVITIRDGAFSGCSGLTSITIPEGVITIRDRAFYGCSGLTSITIPEGVTSIGNSVFEDCSGLETIQVEEGNTIYHSANNCLIETATKQLILGCKNSVIPADGTVTTIRVSAFYGCSRLTSIIIPEGVTTIGSYAFQNCRGLTSITINAITPPTLGLDVFSSTSADLKIYVPDESVEAYKAASRWRLVADKIFAVSQKP